MNDLHACILCGTVIGWEDGDDRRGNIWACEQPGCSSMFCTACFIDRHGANAFTEMIHEAERVTCPACWEKIKKMEENHDGIES